MQDRPVTLAAITGAHGVTGEVRLKLFGEGVATLAQHKSFNDGALTLLEQAPVLREGRGDRAALLAAADIDAPWPPAV